MKIPFFDLSRQYKAVASEIEKAILQVTRSGQYIEGIATTQFEQEMSEYIGVKHVITCGNGTDALRIALQAGGVGAGDEVITTPFSFFATAEAIAQIGAIPVFVDVDAGTLNIDAEKIEEKITDRTKAILPVHIFGMPADMDRINEIAGKRKIIVIEDACQAIGAEYKHKKTGSLGHFGCFSFYPTKNLGACGDAGMITTDDETLATNAIAFKSHGAGKKGAEAYKSIKGFLSDESSITSEGLADALYDPYKYYNYIIGGNSRLDSIQAAILSVKYKKLDSYNERRRMIAERYIRELDYLPIGIPQKNQDGYISCRHQFAIMVEERDRFTEYLAENGIGTGAFYPVPLHLQKAFVDLGYEEGALPVVEGICSRSVCLPVFPELSDDEQEYIIKTIRTFFE